MIKLVKELSPGQSSLQVREHHISDIIEMKENYAPRWQELLVLPSGPMSDSDFLSFSLLSDDFSTSGQGFRAWNPLPLPHLLPRWWLRFHVRPSHVNHVCVSLALSVYLEARSVPFGKQSLVTIFKSPCMCALLVKKGEKVFLEFPGKAKKIYFKTYQEVTCMGVHSSLWAEISHCPSPLCFFDRDF